VERVVNRDFPEIPAHLTVAFACPKCRGPMKTVRNPSYGIGLARHHFLRVCGRCEFALFVPESLIASQPAQPKQVKQVKPLRRTRRDRKKKDGD
jgi:hypothetical protein